MVSLKCFILLSQSGVPVLCGSAYKNVGVQMLMDAVIDYLPSPQDCSHLSIYSYFKSSLAAKVFKVTHDKHKGPLSFLRVYAGKLTKVGTCASKVWLSIHFDLQEK